MTLEGAGRDGWDFSAQAVPTTDNASAGGKLIAWPHRFGWAEAASLIATTG
ncbi:hypothetical protein E0500_042665 [Streptomyces sp. KM273126]|nr:hypothetical protein [Streptomyces sp. KM273126]